MRRAGEAFAYRPVFIGGAPRSGTTLLSAMLSTSRSCNGFAPEFHQLYFLLLAYVQTLGALTSAAPFLPEGRRSLEAQYEAAIRRALDEAWDALGRPACLVLKCCPATLYFPLLSRLFPEAQFVLLFRDPCDVVASRVRVDARRREGLGPTRAEAPRVHARQYARIYAPCLDLIERGAGQAFTLVDYADLVAGLADHLSTSLKIAPLDPELLWRRGVLDVDTLASEPQYSRGWGRPVTSEFTGAASAVLSPAEIAQVLEETASTTTRLKVFRASSIVSEAAVTAA